MSENQTSETVLLQNCVKQNQILLTSIKEYLTSIYKADLGYDEIKDNLFTAIKIINVAEEIAKVYNFENK